MSITTVALLKSDWLNIASSDTTHDALIGRLLLMAEAEAADYCNQPIAQASKTIYFAGDCTQYMSLPFVTVPVTLTTLKYRDLPSDSWTADTGGTLYALEGLHKLYHATGFTYPYYQLIVSVGYTTADAPPSLINAMSEMVKEMFYMTGKEESNARFGVSSISKAESGLTTTVAFKSIRDTFQQKLKPYRMLGWL